MAYQQNTAYGAAKNKTPRLILKNWFTLGWENRDVTWPETVQTPDGKTKPFTPKFSDNIKGAYDAYKDKSKELLKASLYFLIFIVPLLALMLYGLNAMLNLALADSYNFMGGIGIGYAGTVDSLALAKVDMLRVYQMFMVYFFAGALIASLGMAGLGNVARKAIWNEPIKYVAKPFFEGIKKHWWKYLLCVFGGGIIALGLAEVLIWHLMNMTLGIAGAGSWCAVVFSFVIGVPLMFVPFTMLLILPSYKLTLYQAKKNAVVILLNHPLSVVVLAVVCCIPLAIMAVSQIVAIIVYILMIAFGCSLVAMLWTGFGHANYLKCAVLKEYLDENDRVKKITEEREKKYSAQKEIKGDTVAKKPQSKATYVNPKKKKKK